MSYLQINDPNFKQKSKYSGYCFEIFDCELPEVDENTKKRTIIFHQGLSLIIPILSLEKIVLVKQFRYGADIELWELPAGIINKNESPIECAKREMKEETGYISEAWRELISFWVSPQYSTETIHCFLANQLIKTEHIVDLHEISEVRIFSLEKIKTMINNGQIRDAKTLAAICYYLIDIDNKG